MPDLRALRRELTPPAVEALLKVFCDDRRPWNRSQHRIRAAGEAVALATQARSIDELARLVMAQKKPGILIEVWFAIRSDRYVGDGAPDDALALARYLLAAHQTFWKRFDPASSDG